MLLAVEGTAQKKINTSLKHELDSIYAVDQKYRYLYSPKKNDKQADSLANLYGVSKQDLNSFLTVKMEEVDNSNLKRVEEILKQYGYPGKSLVGAPTNEAVYFVLQHSPKISAYIALIEQTARKGELPFNLYAMMHDRLLLQAEKEQLYGTQVYGFVRANSQTGKEELNMFVWPIQDPKNVNKRRKEAGFEQTIEEYTKIHGVEYKVLTLEDVKKMKEK
ncbi:MAG: DUF6624 domain-containing protein [Bacteroidota bacterium]